MRRLRAMWVNVIKVRHLASRLIGDDLSQRIFGIDEKPLHMKEGGLKCVGTLEIAGAPMVVLKENHAQTRERVSLMTTVTSCEAVATWSELMPLELLCKGKSNKRIKDLRPPAGMRVSLQYSEKGSYRNENILRFLHRWLDPWDELRAAKKDWRILLMDVAKSHLGDDIIAFCHGRGYCCLYHYGCTTAVTQVNDTDLHGDFSRVYIELEQVAFGDMQLYDPTCFSRKLEDVLADACAAWRACDHGHGVRDHKFNGLSNALDDSEDNLLSASRDAGRLWSELNMHDVRKAAMDEVDKMLEAGEITTFEDWQKVVVHPADPGVRGFEGDGTELEGTEDIIACAWLGDDERAAILRDDADVLLEDVAKGKLPLEVQEPLRLEISAAKRLARLRELRAASVDLKVPASVKLLDDEIRQVSRGLHAGGSSERQESSRVVRALMDAVVEKERLAIKKRQRQARKFKRVAVLQKAMERRARKRVKAKAKAKAALKKKLDALPIVFNIENTGAPGGQGEQTP